MKFTTFSFVFLFGLGLAQECTSDIQCPYDMRCDTQQADGSSSSYCVFRNAYKSCGGNTPTPSTCDDNGDATECVDDPRKPGCGMSCDVPGICLPKELHTCGGLMGRECPEGLYCYLPKPTEAGQCADCFGQCL